MLKFLKVPKSSISFIGKEEPVQRDQEEFLSKSLEKKQKIVTFEDSKSDKTVQTLEHKKTNTEKVLPKVNQFRHGPCYLTQFSSILPCPLDSV